MVSPLLPHFLGTEMMLIERNSLIRRWSQGQQSMPIAICSTTYVLSVVFYSILKSVC